jgi:hypothetical protein
MARRQDGKAARVVETAERQNGRRELNGTLMAI